MGRFYAVTRNITHTTSNEIVKITAPSTGVVMLHSAFVGQYSDAGDAQAEMMQVLVYRTSSNTSGGSEGYSSNPLSLGDSAFGGSHSVGRALSVTPTYLLRETFNVQAGWYYTPTPEERIMISPSGKLAIALLSPADSLSMNWRIIIEEIGT